MPHQSSSLCKMLLSYISEYIDGELEAQLCVEIEKHLAECEDCRVLVDTTHKTVMLYQRYYRHSAINLPPETNARLWEALEKAGCVTPKEL